MIKYQVHYEVARSKRIFHGIRTIAARNEQEAKARVRTQIEGSFGLWVNRLANA